MKLNKLRMMANEKGFTLIELMIVIAIIGILAAIAIPNFISYRDKSFCSAAETDAGSLQGGLSDYFAIPSNQTFKATTTNANHEMIFPGSQTLRLSGTNTGTIQPAGRGFHISITDGSSRCPLNYRDKNPRWTKTTPGVYATTM